MKAVKHSFKDTSIVDLGTKKIFKYPTPTKEFDIAKMVVDGRYPVEPNKFIIEHKCQFVMYIMKGSGKIYVGEEIIDVIEGDVVFVPTETKFASEGKMEYITVDVPAFFMEQSEEITV